MHAKARTNTSASTFSCIGVQKAEDDCFSEIPVFFFSSAALYLHNFSFKLYRFKTLLWTLPDLKQSYIPPNQAHVEFCAMRYCVWYCQMHLSIKGSPLSIKTAKRWNLIARRMITPPSPSTFGSFPRENIRCEFQNCYRASVFVFQKLHSCEVV